MLAPWLQSLNLVSASLFFLAVNILIVAGSALLWVFTRAIFARRLLFPQPRPITTGDASLTALCILMNVLVSIAGWELWQQGWLTLAADSPMRTLLTFVGMLLVMDLGMYLTHRLAHHPWLYSWLHAAHHDHIETNSLSLFVLSPLEVLGFGGLLLFAILVVAPTETALMIYLTVNVIVGTLGHTGVGFVSADSSKRSPLEHWDTSTFHAAHHTQRTCNFGFYTPLWDFLFGSQSRRVSS